MTEEPGEGQELQLGLDDFEVVDKIEITNPELAAKLKELKAQGLEGWRIALVVEKD